MRAACASTPRPEARTLTAQQPLNNVVRVATQALSAVLGGTQSLHTNGYDEALMLPSQEAARVALRTQQILAYESGVTRTVDPLAGSYFVETLTNRVEEEARAYLSQIEQRGGAAESVGFMRDQIHREAYRFQQKLESGERVVVGVNRFTEEEKPSERSRPDYVRLEKEQSAAVATLREGRSTEGVNRALDRLRLAAQGNENLMPPIIDAVRAMATLGEISATLRDVWGSFTPEG